MQPECNFFFKTWEYEKGLQYYEKTWFAKVGSEKAVGERSSLLLSGSWVPPRVARHLPAVRLIFLLRNPVDRAWANYRFTAMAGYEQLEFAEALEREEDRIAEANRDPFWREIQPHAYFRRGLYHEQLSRWLEHFPRSQLHILRSDALLKHSHGTLRTIYRFLGVDEDFVAGEAPTMSSPGVLDVGEQYRLRHETPVGFDAALQRLREGEPPVNEIDRALRANANLEAPRLDAGIRAALTARYQEANRKLAGMLPFSIEDWF
jgi:hypothetical protein